MLISSFPAVITSNGCFRAWKEAFCTKLWIRLGDNDFSRSVNDPNFFFYASIIFRPRNIGIFREEPWLPCIVVLISNAFFFNFLFGLSQNFAARKFILENKYCYAKITREMSLKKEKWRVFQKFLRFIFFFWTSYNVFKNVLELKCVTGMQIFLAIFFVTFIWSNIFNELEVLG